MIARRRILPRLTQTIAVSLLGLSTLAAVLVLVFIVVVVMRKGLPVIDLAFLFTPSRDMGRQGGILQPMVGTVALPAMALLVALPLGVGTAIYLTEYTRESRLTRAIRFGTDCLAAVPSIVFGLFGFIFFVILLRWGWSLLSGALTLAIMVLPTIIRTSEEAIRAVPRSYREVSVSLGGTRIQTTFRAVLPNALPGVMTGVMLSVGRAVGETAAVIYTAGSALSLPTSVFAPVRTLAVHFYILAREGLSEANAYGTAAVLVILVLLINLTTYWLMNRLIARRSR
jgi:phosphate transport system permease protein